MENDLKRIMRNIKAQVTCDDNYKIITVFILTPQDDKGTSFILDVIAGVKENAKYNNFTKIIYNESMPFSAEMFKDFMLLANDMYRIEAIIPDIWRTINRFWGGTISSELELIDYAIKFKEWKCGKIGFRVIQKF